MGLRSALLSRVFRPQAQLLPAGSPAGRGGHLRSPLTAVPTCWPSSTGALGKPCSCQAQRLSLLGHPLLGVLEGAGLWMGPPPPQEACTSVCLLRLCGLSVWTASGNRAGLSDYLGPATWRFLSLLVTRRGLETWLVFQQFLNTDENEPHGTKKPQFLWTKVKRLRLH